MSEQVTPHKPKNRQGEATGNRQAPIGRSSARGIVAAKLAAGETQKAAAQKAGVSVRTIGGWRQEPEFAAQVEKLRNRMVDRALGKLQSAMGKAAGTLRTLLVAGSEEDIRYKASVKILELAMKLKDAAAMEDRLARVEAMLAGGGDDARTDAVQDQPAGEVGPSTPDPAQPPPAGLPGGPESADAGRGDDSGPVAGTVAPV